LPTLKYPRIEKGGDFVEIKEEEEEKEETEGPHWSHRVLVNLCLVDSNV
jgi:hypothetical protein